MAGMVGARGGLIIIGIEEDEQACAKDVVSVAPTGRIKDQMEQIIRSRVVPWLNGIEICLLGT